MKLRLWMVLGLVAAAYAGVPQAGFVWDDHALVEHNRNLVAPTFENVWLRDLWCCTAGPDSGYHRPLLTVSYLLDRLVWGEGPAGFHVTNVLWHLLVVGLVAALLRPRVGPVRANVAALIFGLHPVQSEAVVWIAARNDLMAAAGVLGTLLALDRKRPVVAGLTAFLACLSKENAYLLPAVLLVWRLAWGERPRAADGLALAAGLGGGLGLRALATLHPQPLGQAIESLTPTSALHGLVTVLGWLVWPWPLTTTASLHMAAPPPAAWPAAVVTVGLLVALVRVGGARAFWLLALAAGVYAPALLGIRWYGNIGERYLYLPLFGIVAAVVAVAPRLRFAPALVVGATAAALLTLHLRVPDWAHEEALFGAAVRRAPDGYAWLLLGVEFGRQKRHGEAMAALDNALRAEPPQRAACERILDYAEPLVPDADLVRFGERWADAGCRGYAGYDGMHAIALARRGLWDEAAAVAETAIRNDVTRRRDEVVRAALDARDGDLASLGARALSWPHGAADLRDQVAGLLLAVRAPNGAGLGRLRALSEDAAPSVPDAPRGASAAHPVAPAPAPQ